MRRPPTDTLRRVLPFGRLPALVAAAGIATACAMPEGTGSDSGQRVAHQVLAHGDQVPASMELGEGLQVFASDPAFRDAWQALAGDSPPRLDFDRHRVVWVRAGRRPTAGHRLRVEGVRRASGRLVVHHVEQRPGEGCLAATVVTHPWVLVRLPAGDEPVESHDRIAAADCG